MLPLLPLLVLFIGVLSHHQPKNDKSDRIILAFNTITVPVGTTIPPIDLTTIIDPNFQREQQYLKFYTKGQHEQLKASAFKFYLTWGWNFTSGIYNPTYDAYLLPGVGLFPYTRLGDPSYPITSDSENPDRDGKWLLHQVGYIAVVNVFVPLDPCTIGTGLGNYSGLKNMTIKYPGDLLEFADFSFSHPKLGVNKSHTNPNNPKHREVLKVRPVWPSRQVSNGEGALDTHGKLQVARADKHGNYPAFDAISDDIGYESSTVHRAVQPNGDTTYYGRASWVFPGRRQLANKFYNPKRSNVDDVAYLFSNPLPR